MLSDTPDPRVQTQKTQYTAAGDPSRKASASGRILGRLGSRPGGPIVLPSMKLAFVAVLLAFAAPAPVAETAPCLEEDVVFESSRKSKTSSVRAPLRAMLRQGPATSAPRPSLLELKAALTPHHSSGWPPPLFSRPPPLA